MTVMERCTSLWTRHPKAKHAAGDILQQFGKILGAKRRLLKALHLICPQLFNGTAL
jgi:hypothetical protein